MEALAFCVHKGLMGTHRANRWGIEPSCEETSPPFPPPGPDSMGPDTARGNDRPPPRRDRPPAHARARRCALGGVQPFLPPSCPRLILMEKLLMFGLHVSRSISRDDRFNQGLLVESQVKPGGFQTQPGYHRNTVIRDPVRTLCACLRSDEGRKNGVYSSNFPQRFSCLSFNTHLASVSGG